MPRGPVLSSEIRCLSLSFRAHGDDSTSRSASRGRRARLFSFVQRSQVRLHWRTVKLGGLAFRPVEVQINECSTRESCVLLRAYLQLNVDVFGERLVVGLLR
jgi:hypothetical protein